MTDQPPSRPAPIVQFKRDLTALIDRKELALPSNVSPEAFRNAAIVAVQDNPAILGCRADSVFKAIRVLAGAGLVPDGREAAIVPFRGEAQAMPMVAGLIKVARNSGKISSLWADVVYEGETLEIWIEGGQRKWNHVRDDGSKIDAMDRGGKIRGAYAVAELSDGTVDFQPMSLVEIEKRRRASSNQKGSNPTGIWEQWYEEMARKTVIRNLCKRLPMSTEDMTRILAEQDPPALRDVTPEPEPPRKTLAAHLTEPETVEGDIVPDDEPHWTDDVDPAAAFPGSPEFAEGKKARADGKPVTDCPHEDDFEKATDWVGGWKGDEE